MNLDFLEIGTCNFDTLIQKASDSTVGISVEPLAHYLDQLPNPKNVIKVNCAISFDNIESDIEIYHIPESTIKENSLSPALKGCNRIGDYHLKHKELNLEKYVSIQKVKQIPISKLLENYNIKTIKHLKIDTEGGDTFILKHLHAYLLTKDKSYYPKKITFESNRLTEPEKVSKIIIMYKKLGYSLAKRKHDTILVLENKK